MLSVAATKPTVTRRGPRCPALCLDETSVVMVRPHDEAAGHRNQAATEMATLRKYVQRWLVHPQRAQPGVVGYERWPRQ